MVENQRSLECFKERRAQEFFTGITNEFKYQTKCKLLYLKILTREETYNGIGGDGQSGNMSGIRRCTAVGPGELAGLHGCLSILIRLASEGQEVPEG